MRYLILLALFSSVALGQQVQSLKKGKDGRLRANFKDSSSPLIIAENSGTAGALQIQITRPDHEYITWAELPDDNILFHTISSSVGGPMLAASNKSINSRGFQITSLSSDTNSQADLFFNIFDADTGLDYTTLTGSGYVWYRYNTELMTLDRAGNLTLPSGNLGVGTSTPNISGSGNTVLTVRDDSGPDSNARLELVGKVDGSNDTAALISMHNVNNGEDTLVEIIARRAGSGGSEGGRFEIKTGDTGATPQVAIKVSETQTTELKARIDGSCGIGNICSGTWTNTCTAATGTLDSCTVGSSAIFNRVGNVVTAGFRINPNTQSTQMYTVDVNLPVISAMTLNTDAFGTCATPMNGPDKVVTARINADQAADKINVTWYADDHDQAHEFWCHFTYIVK